MSKDVLGDKLVSKDVLEYLTVRFLRSNHPKYSKYCTEWIKGLSKEQVDYFIKEKKRREMFSITTF